MQNAKNRGRFKMPEGTRFAGPILNDYEMHWNYVTTRYDVDDMIMIRRLDTTEF